MFKLPKKILRLSVGCAIIHSAMTPEQQKPANDLSQKYQERGSQRVTLAEHEAQQEKKAKKKNIKLHPLAKIIVNIPLILLFCFGIFFIPFMIYSIATSKEKGHEPTDENTEAVEQLKIDHTRGR